MIKPCLYPRNVPRPTDSAGEIILYNALNKSLPKGWYAWHSLRIRTNRNWNGEGDFIIGVPERGIIIIEVKSGNISQIDGRWFQNGIPLPDSPLEQLLEYREKFFTRCREIGCDHGQVEPVVCFPDISFIKEPSEDDLRGHLIGAQDIPYIGEWLEDFSERWLSPARKPPTGLWVDQIHSLWGENWVPSVTLGQELREHRQTFMELDCQQLEVFDRLMSNRRIRVHGPAGSGKTVLARQCAIKESCEGRKVLYLCYTEPLAKWLSHGFETERIRVNTVKKFAAGLLKHSGEITSFPKTTEEWMSTPYSAINIIPDESPWDTIVIDEAQDMTEEDWLLIELLLKEHISCYVFYDQSQTFWPERRLPEFVTTFMEYPLGKQYRSKDGIWEFAQMYAGKSQNKELVNKAISDGIIKIITINNPNRLKIEIGNEINRLKGQNVALEDIVIISLAGETRSSVIHWNEINGQKLCRADAEEAATNLVNDTFLRVKGLERPVVIIVEHELSVDKNIDVRMHIALSRATDAVRIILSEESAEKDNCISCLAIT